MISKIEIGDIKSFWKVANNILGRNKIANNITNHIDHTKLKDFSNELNIHFSTVGQKIHKSTNKTSYLHKNGATVKDSCVLSEVTEQEMIQHINKLKCNSSFGIDRISNEFLKTNSKVLAVPLTYLYNRCLDEGIFLDELKCAIIVPLYKGGDKANFNNYRLVSIISSIGRLFEKILKLQITTFLEKFNIIHKSQYGFQKGKGTMDAVTWFLT